MPEGGHGGPKLQIENRRCCLSDALCRRIASASCIPVQCAKGVLRHYCVLRMPGNAAYAGSAPVALLGRKLGTWQCPLRSRGASDTGDGCQRLFHLPIDALGTGVKLLCIRTRRFPVRKQAEFTGIPGVDV